jgi:hypothetical protein
MFEKVSTRSEGMTVIHFFTVAAYDFSPLVLDDRIDEFSELIRDKYDVEELGDPSSVTEVCIHGDNSPSQ